MRAAVVYRKNDIRIAEVPRPRAGEGEAVVQVRASGICATDVKMLSGAGIPAELPAILGHEVAGFVAELGPGAEEAGLQPGQRVAVYPIAACGACFYCRQGRNSLCLREHGLGHGDDGGFAEYVRMPAEIVRLGGVLDIGDMPFDLAAMIEPTSCCVAAADPVQDKSRGYGRCRWRRSTRSAAYNHIEGIGRAGHLCGRERRAVGQSERTWARRSLSTRREKIHWPSCANTRASARMWSSRLSACRRPSNATCPSCVMAAFSTSLAARREEK